METKKNLLTKEELSLFNLWQNYFNFLTSAKELFEKELAKKLNGEKIQSFVESEFYEKDGSCKKNSSKNYPDAEEVHFEVANKEYSVGFCFYLDNVKPSFELYSISIAEEDGKQYSTLRYGYDCGTKEMFSSEVIEAAVYWIQTGELTDFAKEVVEAYNED